MDLKQYGGSFLLMAPAARGLESMVNGDEVEAGGYGIDWYAGASIFALPCFSCFLF
jgi:hypothetical protein